ncbi:aspartyl-phosphate phosphatase Spo0E family protein [Clostridium estertheticum]|uniref:Aspartyl-phosphate phosphatase Spo0E family protein n=1 Tax=Clostridium estertheticum TaxID=238834 RepID=A0AA47I9B0_9CLOT|nr:aspartyl-phosphate phosphatase Spo0E family protein [Clostridium estertheticum]MBU3157203.1 aspartyl-phosphate phosphatase Spo0E family protein [Clostridium estertheticum]MBU3178884.1 aspartyl-phosphate phosphatase Spo0E family protein [Clostridium estertheticum]MBU3201835.1 aspartyl-phosphate phosphatase Spo0E family protein [Clostridium estertheticum]WAG62710.1 aspartyl-phosphate phosphatase Spo0E family protein [Clostridium estertheticum]WAG67790.1 aspartyl-phosphate phosphatase Spo0E fa
MEELRDELTKLINEKGPLNERTILVSQELDKLIVSHYCFQDK